MIRYVRALHVRITQDKKVTAMATEYNSTLRHNKVG